MGHREDLMDGAKRCLYEKGYAGTTARDIVNASGTNLASIGYHYGSKEKLPNQALIQATGDWGEELNRALEATRAAEPDPLRRFELSWNAVVALFEKHRMLWVSTFESVGQIDSSELLDAFAEVRELAWRGLANLIQGIDEDADPEGALVVGKFDQALLLGLMAQHLIYPGDAPDGADIAEALRRITASAASPRSGGGRASSAGPRRA
jgi:AcrR family transcriptional regulator